MLLIDCRLERKEDNDEGQKQDSGFLRRVTAAKANQNQ